MESLKATKRGELGTRQVRRLRKEGRIPGIIYGHGEESLAVTLDRHDFEAALYHGERLFELEMDGGTQNVLLKAVQYDTFGQETIHVDLTRVDLDELAQVTVSIVLRGTPAGLSEGGFLEQVSSVTSIECAVRSIPSEIVISVVDLNIGDAIYMRDLPLPEDAKLLADENAIVCRITVVAEEAEPEEAEEGEEGGAGPEVIGETPGEEGDDSEPK